MTDARRHGCIEADHMVRISPVLGSAPSMPMVPPIRSSTSEDAKASWTAKEIMPVHLRSQAWVRALRKTAGSERAFALAN
eukprot:9352077-Karenia_brevis.AAC.1